MHKEVKLRIKSENIYADIADVLLVFFIVARQAFRYNPGFSQFWPIARYAFLLVVGLKLLRNPRVKKTYFWAWEIFFLFFAFICSGLSMHQDNGFLRCVEVLGVFLDVSCVLFYCLPERKLDLLARAFLLSGVVIVLIQLSRFNVAEINIGKNMIANRLSLSEFENPNLTALKLFTALLCGCYLVFFNCKFKMFTICMTALSCAGMMLTGARKTFVIAVVLIVLLFMRGKRKYLKMVILIAAAILAYNIIMTNTVFYNIIGWRLENLSGVDESAQERAMLLKEAVAVGWEHLLFGVGLHNFMYYSSVGTYAHNNYAELFADVGIIGLVIYYSVHMLGLFRTLVYTKGKQRTFWLLFILSILTVDYGQVSYNLFTSVMMIAMLSLAFSDNEQYSDMQNHAVTGGIGE